MDYDTPVDYIFVEPCCEGCSNGNDHDVYVCDNCNVDTINMRGFNKHMRNNPDCAALYDVEE